MPPPVEPEGAPHPEGPIARSDAAFAATATRTVADARKAIAAARGLLPDGDADPQVRRRRLALGRFEREIAGHEPAAKLTTAPHQTYRNLLSADAAADETTRLSTSETLGNRAFHAIDSAFAATGFDDATKHLAFGPDTAPAGTPFAVGGAPFGIPTFHAASDDEIAIRDEQKRRRRLPDTAKQEINVAEAPADFTIDRAEQADRHIAAMEAQAAVERQGRATRYDATDRTIAAGREQIERQKASPALAAGKAELDRRVADRDARSADRARQLGEVKAANEARAAARTAPPPVPAPADVAGHLANARRFLAEARARGDAAGIATWTDAVTVLAREVQAARPQADATGAAPAATPPGRTPPPAPDSPRRPPATPAAPPAPATPAGPSPAPTTPRTRAQTPPPAAPAPDRAPGLRNPPTAAAIAPASADSAPAPTTDPVGPPRNLTPSSSEPSAILPVSASAPPPSPDRAIVPAAGPDAPPPALAVPRAVPNGPAMPPPVEPEGPPHPEGPIARSDAAFAATASPAVADVRKAIAAARGLLPDGDADPQVRRRRLALGRFEREIAGHEPAAKLTTAPHQTYRNLISADAAADETTRLSSSETLGNRAFHAIDSAMAATGLDDLTKHVALGPDTAPAGTPFSIEGAPLGVPTFHAASDDEIAIRDEQKRRRRLPDAAKQEINVAEAPADFTIDRGEQADRHIAAADARAAAERQERATRYDATDRTIAAGREEIERQKASPALAAGKAEVDRRIADRDARSADQARQLDEVKAANRARAAARVAPPPVAAPTAPAAPAAPAPAAPIAPPAAPAPSPVQSAPPPLIAAPAAPESPAAPGPLAAPAAPAPQAPAAPAASGEPPPKIAAPAPRPPTAAERRAKALAPTPAEVDAARERDRAVYELTSRLAAERPGPAPRRRRRTRPRPRPDAAIRAEERSLDRQLKADERAADAALQAQARDYDGDGAPDAPRPRRRRARPAAARGPFVPTTHPAPSARPPDPAPPPAIAAPRPQAPAGAPAPLATAAAVPGFASVPPRPRADADAEAALRAAVGASKATLGAMGEGVATIKALEAQLVQMQAWATQLGRQFGGVIQDVTPRIQTLQRQGQSF